MFINDENLKKKIALSLGVEEDVRLDALVDGAFLESLVFLNLKSKTEEINAQESLYDAYYDVLLAMVGYKYVFTPLYEGNLKQESFDKISVTYQEDPLGEYGYPLSIEKRINTFRNSIHYTETEIQINPLTFKAFKKDTKK